MNTLPAVSNGESNVEVLRQRIEIEKLKYLLAPVEPGTPLDRLRDELNAIAQIRHGARLAFCQRLSVVYMSIAERPYGGHIHDDATSRFMTWCRHNLRSATGKIYSTGTLRGYLQVGFARNPKAFIEHQNAVRDRYRRAQMQAIRGLVEAVEKKKHALAVATLKTRHNMASDVATEVNKLMTAWEHASPEGRAQFLYHITGRVVPRWGGKIIDG